MHQIYMTDGKNRLVRFTAMLLAIITIFVLSGMGQLDAAAASRSPAKFYAEKTFDTDYTHPYNHQIDTINLHWTKMSGATYYEVYILGGKYTKWTKYKKVSTNSCTVTGLERTTDYQFKLKTIYGNYYTGYSPIQKIKTARFNYDQAGWEAVCRIVYHEVGMINDSMWDKPMVYVADCVANRFVSAKYGKDNIWVYYYRNYKDIQSMIYNSGNFMSSAGLTRDGAVYSRVPDRVKNACWGAVYAKTSYKSIVNDYKVYYWCNRGYYTSSSKIAYTFRIPWGYFYIWREYWG